MSDRSGIRVERVVGVLIGLWLLGGVGHAQTSNADAWPFGQRHIADVASTVLLAGDMAADAGRAISRELGTTKSHQTRAVLTAVGCEGLKFGGANGGSLLAKHYLPRWRPDGSDRLDSGSEHSSNAFAGADVTHGTKEAVLTVAVAVLVAYLRTAANKHDLVGILEGVGIGTGAKYGTWLVPACRGVS